MMCGFAGYLPRDPMTPTVTMEPMVADMLAAIEHRGPDDHGVWLGSRPAVALGFRRLAIVDLTPSGHQPMVSPSGRFILCFNGEIYNHGKLRARLQTLGQTFRGHSDTEVFLAAIEREGLAAVLSQAAGMFAFALWDTHEQQLTLGRDRLGEKPLYYGMVDGDFVFASELHAIERHPRFAGELEPVAITSMVRHGYVAAPWSIYRGLFKLPPGHTLTIPLRPGLPSELPPPKGYWSVEQHWEPRPVETRSPQDWADELERRLTDIVREESLADVPLGAFLSGGIDSSLIVALMQRVNSQPVRTFSIGFREAGFDEAPHAKRVAAHLGTKHTEFYVTAEDALAVIPQLPRIYDEPFADASQIPTRLLCGLAREHVTVALSGDGGDELLNGYERYRAMGLVWSAAALVPQTLRPTIASLAQRLLGADPVERGLRRQLAWACRIIAGGDRVNAYRRAVSANPDPERLLRAAVERSTIFDDQARLAHLPLPRWMQATDLATYLPDDILVKVDRAAMSVSLETRAPFLDHRFAEFAATIPLSLLRRGGQGKWLLRQVLYRHVPRELIERPKAGFAVPLGPWLRGPLRDWAEEQLSITRLAEGDWFDGAAVQTLWREHLAGSHDRAARLWPILMLQAWRADRAARAHVKPSRRAA